MKFSTSLHRYVIQSSVIILFSVIFLGACQLIFEPPHKAIDRVLDDMASGSDRVMLEMVEDESLIKQLQSLRVVLSSDLYDRISGFWDVTLIEEESDTGLYFVHVSIRIPSTNGQRESKHNLIFEMSRIKLRWKIYSVRGLENFTRSANRARGIS